MDGIDVMLVPYDSGRRGYRMGAGPEALIGAGLVPTLQRGERDVALVTIEAAPTDAKQSAFALCAHIADAVRSARARQRFPLVLTGNCISTVGAVAGLAGGRPALLWFDAHADLNTPATSTTGFLDGMAAATCLGWCHTEEAARIDGFAPLPESALVLAGARDIDPPEQEALRRSGVRLATVADLRRDSGVLSAALDGADSVYIHLDLDVLDPDDVGRANQFAAPHGLRVDELLRAITTAAAGPRVAGMTVSAYDPTADSDGAVAAAAIRCIASAAEAAGAGG